MNFKSISMVLAVFLFFAVTPVWSQELMIYPAKGQSNDQMEKDKFECYTWAKGQTGFDPMQMPTTSSPPPSQQKKSVGGSALTGGVIGGAGGAVIGGIAGGTIGGVRSSRQNRQTEQQRQQWEQQQANQYMQQRNEYNRAHAACLEGRGYTVK